MQRLNAGLSGLYNLIDRAVTSLDARAVVGFTLAFFGASILAAPWAAPMPTLAAGGFSPILYGLGALMGGCIILWRPHVRAYLILLFPLVMYVGGLVADVMRVNAEHLATAADTYRPESLTSLIVHCGFVALAIIAEHRPQAGDDAPH